MSTTPMRLPPMLSVDETAPNLNVSTKTVRGPRANARVSVSQR